MIGSPEVFHRQSLENANAELARVKRLSGETAWLRLACFVGIVAGVVLALKDESHGYILAAASLILFLAAVKRYVRLSTDRKLLQIRVKLHGSELDALQGNYAGFDAGSRFIDHAHSYSFDLDVFGEHSLFNQVCRTVTPGGANRLAALMESPVSTINVLRERQEMVNELVDNHEFCIAFRVAGGGIGKTEKEGFEKQLIDWTQQNFPFLTDSRIRLLVRISTILVLLVFSLKLSVGLSLSWLTIPLIFNALLLGFHIRTINNINAGSGIVSEAADQLHKLLSVTQDHLFRSEKLRAISTGSKSASVAIHQLYKLLSLFDIRLNMILGAILNLLFLFDFHCLFRIEAWKKKHAGLIRSSFEDMTLLDVQQSLAGWAFLHQDNVYPEFTNEHMLLTARNLKHPLIDSRNAVGNVLNIGQQEQLVVLTGANMTGKSTWLRTIGLSAIAAYCGLPVAAEKARFPPLNVYTSMRITDSLDTGISYFRAELNRLKSMLDLIGSSDRKWLVLLDEPLRGTNSGDKQAGTIGLIKRLLKVSATGLVATHDAALCELKNEYAGKLSNYHFDSSIGDHELLFDYTLKPGCSTSANATLLMKLTGILDE